jgi:hypothetical protein
MGLLEIKFQPEINFGNANFQSSLRRRPGRIYKSTADFDKILTRLVMRPTTAKDYYVSAGTADFTVPWLQRLYRHAEINGGPIPKIRRLIFKCISIELMDILLANHMLAVEFKERLEANLRGITHDSLITSYGVQIEVRRWTRLPPFHGHMFGDELLIGPWSIDSTGLLHVQTPMTHFRGKLIRESLDTVRKDFFS